MHIIGEKFFLRDLTVYSDQNPQPFLKDATREGNVEQRMPALLDGYHWSKNPGSSTEEGAGGFFLVGGKRLQLSGTPKVTETGSTLEVEFLVGDHGILRLRFDERTMSCSLSPTTPAPLILSFEWDPTKSTLTQVKPQRVAYRWQNFDYAVDIKQGKATATANGWAITANRRGISLQVAQRS